MATCIFGENREWKKPAYRTPLKGQPGQKEILWTDGSANRNGMANSRCGAGIWLTSQPHLKKVLRVPGSPPTNNRAELVAIMWALDNVQRSSPMLVKMDSKLSINVITEKASQYRDKGWLRTLDADIIKKDSLPSRKQAS